jgi:hypothetical protein
VQRTPIDSCSVGLELFLLAVEMKLFAKKVS